MTPLTLTPLTPSFRIGCHCAVTPLFSARKAEDERRYSGVIAKDERRYNEGITKDDRRMNGCHLLIPLDTFLLSILLYYTPFQKPYLNSRQNSFYHLSEIAGLAEPGHVVRLGKGNTFPALFDTFLYFFLLFHVFFCSPTSL